MGGSLLSVDLLKRGGRDEFFRRRLSRPLRDINGETRVDTLATLDSPNRTSIVRRGKKIRTDFLCQEIPIPPDDVDLSLGGAGDNLTQSERLEAHREVDSCNGCHSLMDPIGLAFEEIDAIGRLRSEDEQGAAIVTGGEITQTLDADGPVTSIAEVAEALSTSVEAEQCYLIQNFRFFFGRESKRADLCSQAQLTKFFRDGDHRLVDVLLGIARTDAFLYKSARDQKGAVQ